ncbi:MAG: PAN domain-containing protein [Nitrospira sp.]|nr:PAN domain-containing protein [Nitrospira sp.]
MCFLKNAKPAPRTDNCCISGVKTDIVGPHIIAGPAASANEGLDYPGNDYKRLLTSVPDPQECANFCRQDIGCKAYTYVKPGAQGPAGVCYLKNSIPPSTNNACCVSGVKSYPPNALDEVSFEAKIDLPGADYASIPLSKPDPFTCAYACRQDAKCRAYTFVSPQGGQPAKCFLKNAAPAKKNSSCCVSGMKTPDTGLKTALVRGAAPKPNWGQCPKVGALDVLDKLCSTNLIPGMTCKAPGPQAKCADYTRQIPVGAGVTDFLVTAAPPVQSFNNYEPYGARGKALGEATMCLFRELSPSFVGSSGNTGKPMIAGWSGSNFLGTLSFKQTVGYKDFDPKTLRFDGYRNLSFCAPIVGCYDAVAQDFAVKLDKYDVVPSIEFQRPLTPNGSLSRGHLSVDKLTALTDYYALTVSSDLAEKSVTLLPPSFVVATPVGPITVQPSFDYAAREHVFAPPFKGIDTVLRPAGTGPSWSYPVELSDIYGTDNAIAFPLLHPKKGVGWQSQIGLGDRDPRSPEAGGVWSPSGSPPNRPDRELRTARDDKERIASAEMKAKARLSYPKAGEVDKYLPSWVPVGHLKFEIWVEPEARAAFSSRFDILSAHGRQKEAGDIGAGGSSWSLGDVTLLSNAANSFGFNLATGVDLKVTIPVPLSGDLTIVDVHPRYKKNLGEGPSFHDGPGAYFASDADQVTRLKPYRNFKTFLTDLGVDSMNAGPDYVQACLAQAKQAPVPPPPPTATPDDPSKLFNDHVEVPCNVCAYWNGQNPATFSNGKSHTFMPATRPPGEKYWQCDMQTKSGCHDFCVLNPKTGTMTYKRPPDADLKIENKIAGKTYTGDICFLQTPR